MPFGDERNSTESLGSDGTEFQIQEALTTSIILDKDQQVVAFQPRFQGRARTPSPNPTEMDIMDALTDIHRVLYLGEEFLDQEGSKKSWEQKVESLRKVIEQYFEGDCGSYLSHCISDPITITDRKLQCMTPHLSD